MMRMFEVVYSAENDLIKRQRIVEAENAYRALVNFKVTFPDANVHSVMEVNV